MTTKRKNTIISLIKKNDKLFELICGASNALGWDIELPDVSKEILDLMGVPRDNTLDPKWAHLQLEPAKKEDLDDGFFCRDYLTDILYENHLTAKEKYENIKEAIEEYQTRMGGNNEGL